MMNLFEKITGKTGVHDEPYEGTLVEGAPELNLDAAAEHKQQKAAELRERIQKLDEGIQAITASIDTIVEKIREGGKIAGQSGNESLKALNAKLETEAQAEKLQLLEQKQLFEWNKMKLERELRDISL